MMLMDRTPLRVEISNEISGNQSSEFLFRGNSVRWMQYQDVGGSSSGREGSPAHCPLVLQVWLRTILTLIYFVGIHYFWAWKRLHLVDGSFLCNWRLLHLEGWSVAKLTVEEGFDQQDTKLVENDWNIWSEKYRKQLLSFGEVQILSLAHILCCT